MTTGQPVDLSGKDFSEVSECGYTIQQRPSSWFHSLEEQQFMRKSTQSLHVRLRGHWWDKVPQVPYRRQAPYVVNVSPFETAISAENDQRMQLWREQTNGKLKALFEDLPNFEQLDDVLLQVGAEPKEMIIGPWRYVYASTLKTLFFSVPMLEQLNTLTLDLYAGYQDDVRSEQDHDCACASLAAILPLVPEVRLRLRRSCAALFQLTDDLNPQNVRLKSLVLKLHMPYHNGAPMCGGPLWCHGDETESASVQHYRNMIDGARKFVQTLSRAHAPAQLAEGTSKTPFKTPAHRLDRFRISWPPSSTREAKGFIEVETADILSDRLLAYGPGFFIYEDHGEDCWEHEELEVKDDMVDYGSLDKALKD